MRIGGGDEQAVHAELAAAAAREGDGDVVLLQRGGSGCHGELLSGGTTGPACVAGPVVPGSGGRPIEDGGP